MDQHSDLFALNDQGEAFQLDKEDWQASEAKPRPEAQWKKIATPDDEPLGSLRTGDDQQLNATLLHGDDKPLARQNNHDWKAVEPSESKDVLGDLHGRLHDGVKTRRIPGTGLTARFTASALGRGGMETQNRVSTKEFITAHVFKPTLEMPRWVKATGDSLVHTAKGRDGLNEVYQAEGKVIKKLEAIADANTPLPATGEDLKSRIARLDLGPEGKELVEQLEGFRSELENHARKSTVHLGQSKGLLNEHGEFNPPSKRTALSMGMSDVARKLNINSSDHNLMQELQGALKKIGPSEENPTGELLGKLEEKGMKISHQKEEIPLGRRRNPSDDLALTKARLALDVVALKDLSDLVDKIENEQKQAQAQTPPHPSQPAESPRMRTAQIMEYRDGLLQLRDVQYEEHPVKQVTDMGFRGHASLESTYDGLKAFIKGFSKTDHATSSNLRAATGSTTQKELAGTLKSALKQLDHGDDEISIQRSYGASLSTPFVGLIGKPLGPFPNGSVGAARTYTMNAERDGEGINVYILREGALSAKAGVGAGKDVLTDITGEKSNSKPIGNDRTFQPAIRLDADVSATATGITRNGLVFKIADEDIDQFVDHLIDGKITPMELMKNGYSHEVQKGQRFNFDVNLSAIADARAGFGLSESGSTPLSAAARATGGASVNVNLLNYSDYSLVSTMDKGTRREGGMNRPRFFNNATAGIHLRTQIAGSHALVSGRSSTTEQTNTAPAMPTKAPTAGSAGLISAPALSGSVTVESKTTKRVKFLFVEAQPLKESDVNSVSGDLKNAFKDKATEKELARLTEQSTSPASAEDPEKALESHLEGLNTYFAEKKPQNDEQYAALRALTKANNQHVAAKNHHNMLDNARFESSYTNLSRLDQNGVLTQLLSDLNPKHVESNAERITGFMAQDPKLNALIKHLQSTEGTLARVRLELKDGPADTVDIGSRNGTITNDDLSKMLGTRDNMRIKAITVFHSVTQPESFTTPTPLLSASSSASLSISKTLGKINFSYGEDQNVPKSYTLDGDIARTDAGTKALLTELKDAGLQLKS
ncbi:AvrE-family type 3 secretion system effector [Pseudomonas sp. FP1742]|nr:AvrE-family type 3 secretion system effector [Pseudomonas sp. FP1742]WLG53797.1 AvrE-family type 3 secretion system effector [Pseudomonas sp. FP1742]